MRTVRNLYVAVAVVAGFLAGGLFLGGLAEWLLYGKGTEADWHLILSVCYVVGAVGVVCLGWYWAKAGEAVTSIARQLKEELTAETAERAKKGIRAENFAVSLAVKQPAVIKELGEMVNGCLDSCRAYTSELEEQVKDLQIQVQLSRRQKRNTEAIIYSIRDAVIVVDEFDRLLMANEAAGRLFKFDFESSQHRPINEILRTFDKLRSGCAQNDRISDQDDGLSIDGSKNGFVDFLRQSRLSKAKATKREIEFSEDGKLRAFDCIVSCVYDEGGKVCGVVAVLHDVTREKEISQMKNDFVSHVSHELKTPLASITAYSEMLMDGEADDEETREEFYSVIQSQAERLNRLIEDILNVSRIESGLIKIEKRAVSLAILIEEQLQMIKSAACEKNIEIISQKPIVFDQVYADKDMFSQVIVNLLSNAVKYTRPGGSIRIQTEVDEIARRVKVSVTDTGVGIPEDELEHVFDKFYRVGANKGEAKGTGLGLNLVKQIVEKVHAGRVFVTSQVDAGSTFGFELPLATRETVKA